MDKKNKNIFAGTDELTELFGDDKVELPFRDMAEGMDRFFGLVELAAELVNLLRMEDDLRKHHRAYLHVREKLNRCADNTAEFISNVLTDLGNKEHIYDVTDSPFAGVDEEDVVTISKEKYNLMVEDLLTMAELIDMVSDMRISDLRCIREMGKFLPAYAAYENSRLSLYRDAAKEAEDIMNRWDDEYEPDEYFSD